MTEAKKTRLGPIPEGDYEVLITRITPKVGQIFGRAYIACECIIQDEGDYQGRKVFYCLAREGTHSDRMIITSAIKNEGASWIPRYASARVAYCRGPEKDIQYNTIKRLAII